MSNSQAWLYIDAAGQQVGPVPAEELQNYVTSGHITAETQLWTEGLENWLPASQIEGLVFQAAAPQAHNPQINLGAAQSNPYSSPAAAAPQAIAPQAGGDYPIPFVNKINIVLYMSCLIGGIVLLILGIVLLAASSPTPEEVATNPDALEQSGSIALPIMLYVLGLIALLITGIMHLIAIYRAWFILKPGGGSVSPGKAIGLMFIPLFGPIWRIIVLCKLPGEWNRIVSQYANTAAAPRLSIAMAICTVFIPIIGQILWMLEISKGINFIASARLMPGTNPAQPSAGGGIVLR